MTLVSQSASWPSARTWAQFSASRGLTPPSFSGSLVDGGLWRYEVERVRAVRGRAPASIEGGWQLLRTESRAALRRPTCEVCLEGVTTPLAYTTAEERRALVAPAPRRDAPLAVLVLIKKSEAWWRMAADERRAVFAGNPDDGHLAQPPPTMPLHRLYHARHLPESEWDFLTLFEIDDDAKGTIDELLARMRGRTREWSYVEREAELWLRQRPR